MCRVVLSDSLDVSRPGKLIFVVFVQSLSRKDGEALPNFLRFDTGVNIPCGFVLTRILLCLSIFVARLEGKIHAFTADSDDGFMS